MPRPRWGDKKEVEKIAEVVESVPEVTEPWEMLDKGDKGEDQVSSLPQDIQDLGKLLAEVAGEDYSDFFDPKYDQVSPNSIIGPVSLGLKDDRDKRFIPGTMTAALPIFSKYAGGLLKSMLQQVIYHQGE